MRGQGSGGAVGNSATMHTPRFAALLALLLAAVLGPLAGCTSPTVADPTTPVGTTASDPSAPPATLPAPLDDAAADAQCNACTATGGTWMPHAHSCVLPTDHVPMVADLPAFRVCPGVCSATNCAACLSSDSCAAAGCTFHTSGPAYSCS